MELKTNKSYQYFNYAVNYKRMDEGAPKALVFQGSYMNGMGYKFLENSFGEYISIHDYQNILDFDYYFNIFQPEVVVFEVAEYTFNNSYFDYEGIKNFQLNPQIQKFNTFTTVNNTLTKEDINIQTGYSLTDIYVSIHNADYVYMQIEDNIYDMDYDTDKFKVTLTNQQISGKEFSVITIDEESKTKYVYKLK